jgi:hypothetical protein
MSSGWFLGFRFLNFFQYVLDHAEIDYFVFADAFDVEVAANPFPAMIADGRDLFVQEEWRLNGRSPYMMDRFAACNPDGREVALLEAQMILNCGVWGGRRAAVLAVLKEMADVYAAIISRRPGNEQCVALGLDMIAFNRAVYAVTGKIPLDPGGRTHSAPFSLALNEPLTPVYRNCPFEVVVRSGASRERIVPNASCQTDLPAKVDASFDKMQTEDWVRNFCNYRPGPKVVSCDALPFSMIHKGSIRFE